LSNQGVLTPIEALAKEGRLKGAITSYKIARVADGKHDGTITFGGMDATKYDPATLVTIPNVSKIGFWEGHIDAFSLDDVDMEFGNRTGIFDTGTTNILAPEGDAKKIHRAIPGAAPDGQGGFTLPCNATASLALTIGGRTFKIDSRDLSAGPVDEADPTSLCVSRISFDSNIMTAPTEWLVRVSQNRYLRQSCVRMSVGCVVCSRRLDGQVTDMEAFVYESLSERSRIPWRREYTSVIR
jgi:hypothetical protein